MSPLPAPVVAALHRPLALAGATRPWTAAPISASRLTKAWRCVVAPPHMPGVFVVFSPSGAAYTVQVAFRDAPLCECGDHLYRDALCAHALAVMLRTRVPRIVAAIARWRLRPATTSATAHTGAHTTAHATARALVVPSATPSVPSPAMRRLRPRRSSR